MIKNTTILFPPYNETQISLSKYELLLGFAKETGHIMWERLCALCTCLWDGKI